MNQAEAAAAPPEDVLRQLGSSPAGLTAEEAGRRLREQGPNAIGTQGRSLGKIVAEQARNGINLLLTGAGVLTIVTGDAVDGAIILLLILLNVGLSIVQDYRAERALEALRNMLPMKARVIRDGAEVAVPATELVPGDVVRLFSGDLVPTDIRLLESHVLQVNQASLTGESVPQEKDPKPVTSAKPLGPASWCCLPSAPGVGSSAGRGPACRCSWRWGQRSSSLSRCSTCPRRERCFISAP